MILCRKTTHVIIIMMLFLLQQSNGQDGSVQTSKVVGPSSSRLPTSPTSPTTVPSLNSALSSPVSPLITPVTAGRETLKDTRDALSPRRAREHLVDLTADNKDIASKHRLHPKTRTSVLQTVDGWFTGESSSRVMLIHGPPGCGKTCLSAELCRRYSARRQLIGGHFFHWKAARPDHNRAVTVLLGLAYRMCELVPGYV